MTAVTPHRVCPYSPHHLKRCTVLHFGRHCLYLVELAHELMRRVRELTHEHILVHAVITLITCPIRRVRELAYEHRPRANSPTNTVLRQRPRYPHHVPNTNSQRSGGCASSPRTPYLSKAARLCSRRAMCCLIRNALGTLFGNVLLDKCHICIYVCGISAYSSRIHICASQEHIRNTITAYPSHIHKCAS